MKEASWRFIHYAGNVGFREFFFFQIATTYPVLGKQRPYQTMCSKQALCIDVTTQTYCT